MILSIAIACNLFFKHIEGDEERETERGRRELLSPWSSTKLSWWKLLKAWAVLTELSVH
jgi:hypothetical protein